MYKGKILVAHPHLKSSIFKQSVIFIYQDVATISTCGVILNRTTDWTLDYVFDYKGINYDSDKLVQLGGPVDTTSITLLHTSDFYSSNTAPVNDTVSVSSDNFMFEKIAEHNEPEQWRLFVGYSAWEPKQLDYEVFEEKAWLVTDYDSDLIFNYNGEAQWELAIEKCSQNMIDSFFA